MHPVSLINPASRRLHLSRCGPPRSLSAAGLSNDSVACVLKRAAARARAVGNGAAETDMIETGAIGGHSLRVGHITQAAENGVAEFTIMRQSGHPSVAMLRRYIRSDELFRHNAAAGLGL